MQYTDKYIIDEILNGNTQIISYFFCNSCKGLVYHIHSKVTQGRYEPDEIINELYLYLSDKNWHKLRNFDFRSTLTTWVSVVGIRYYRKKLASLIENTTNEALNLKHDCCEHPIDTLDSHIDVHSALSRMPNKRYRQVIQQLDLHEMAPEKLAEEMQVTTANLYNIHRRALQQLKSVMYGKDDLNR